MRVVFVHSHYRADQPSGENVVVEAQARALISAGHDVYIVSRYTDTERQKPFYVPRSVSRVATGFGASPLEDLRELRPDVVHVHNLFPNWGSRWLSRWPGPVVATLHNFRSICPNGLLYRDGIQCTLCPSGRPLSALEHACYSGSRLATLAPLVGQYTHASRLVTDEADRLLVPSHDAFQRFADFGLPRSKMLVLPHFAPDARVARTSSGQWIFLGRLSEEKGLLELIDEWPPEERLLVVGDGPLRSLAAERVSGRANIGFIGSVSRAVAKSVLAEAIGLVFPGRAPETFGLVAVEALAAGTPIVARQGTAVADLVQRYQVGRVYHDGGLQQALQTVRRDQRELAQRARSIYESEFTEEIWVKRTTEVYESLIG